jgi:RHS repeat-associated protein
MRIARNDALGRRIKRTKGSEVTKFTYDGEDVILDDNKGVITKYQNGLGIDNKLKMVTNGNAKYFLQDHLGSTTALTNSSGNVIESATYDSFGNSTNNLSTRYQFTGREYDSDIGLQYSRARWYDATIGRFISEDPIGFGGGNVNLYGYVRNNPLNGTDPSGNFPFFFSPNLPMNNKSPHQPNRNLDCFDEECKKDIADFVDDIEKARDEMNSNGTRISNADGNINNIRASFNGVINLASNALGLGNVVNPYAGCQEQAINLQNRIKPTPNYDTSNLGHDSYGGFKDVNPSNFDLGPFRLTSHKWVKALPKNPKCPKLRLDVWNDSWEIIP